MTSQTYLISTQSYRHEYESGAEIPTQYGYLVETDFAGFQRCLSIPTPTENPYGERLKPGLRGLHVWEGRVYVASWNTIYVVDYRSFSVVESFTHPLMSDLHGLYVDGQELWVASSLIDSVLVFDSRRALRGVLSLTDSPLYPSRERQAVDLAQDYRWHGKVKEGFRTFHANHITPYDGRTMLVTGRGDGENKGRVIRVARDTLDYRVWARRLRGPHDGLFLRPDCFAVTETNSATVALIKTDGWPGPRVSRRLHLPTGEARFWTRGLCPGPDGTLLVGKSVWKGDNRQASVVQITTEGEVVAEYPLDLGDYPECRIFQIVPAPG